MGLAKYDPERDILFWHMGDVEGGGDYYQSLVVRHGKAGAVFDKDTGEPFQWPCDVAAGVKEQLAIDGWNVVSDGNHFAGLAEAHHGWSLRNLAWLVGKLLPPGNKMPAIWAQKGEEVQDARI